MTAKITEMFKVDEEIDEEVDEEVYEEPTEEGETRYVTGEGTLQNWYTAYTKAKGTVKDLRQN